MQYAIFHKANLLGNPMEIHQANTPDEARKCYFEWHKEQFEDCETVEEMCKKYPVLASSLLMVPVQ